MNFLRRERWFLGFLGVMAGLLLIAWGVGTGKDSAWWASWGQWVGGLGSIAAAWTAVWIAVEGWRRSDRQAREQARHLEEVQTRELASKFGVWIEERPVRTRVKIDGPVNHAWRDVKKFVVMYSNSGTQPMYKVDTWVDFGFDSSKYDSSRRYLPPATEPAYFEESPGMIDTYLERSLLLEDPKMSGHDVVIEFEKQIRAESAVILVAFTDANGIRWYREEGGQLTQVDGNV